MLLKLFYSCSHDTLNQSTCANASLVNGITKRKHRHLVGTCALFAGANVFITGEMLLTACLINGIVLFVIKRKLQKEETSNFPKPSSLL